MNKNSGNENVKFFISNKEATQIDDMFDWVNAYINNENDSIIELFNTESLRILAEKDLELVHRSGIIQNLPPIPASDPLFKRIVKKIMFKLCGWYFEYLRSQQNAFNVNIARCLDTTVVRQNKQQELLREILFENAAGENR